MNLSSCWHLNDGQLIRGWLKRGNGVSRRTVQGARIDDARSSVPLVAQFMGVAVNQVISAASDRRAEGREFMSVREGDALPVHGDFAAVAVHGDANIGGVAGERVMIPVAIAPHKVAIKPRELVKD